MYGGNKGWFGNSQGHALAAKGVRMYAAKKQVLVDPIFFARKREEFISTYALVDAIRDGISFNDLVAKYPNISAMEKEDLRQRGIKSLEMRDGSNVLSNLDRAGIDHSVNLAKENPALKERMLVCLTDSQRSSFIQPQKVEFLKRRLAEVD